MNEEKPLSEKHRRVIDIYFSNKFNQQAAYQEVYPNCAINSLDSQSSKLFKKLKKTPYFIQKAQEKEEKRQNTYNENLETLKEVIRLGLQGDDVPGKDGQIFNKKQLGAIVQAVNEINKMEGNHAETKLKLSGTGDNNAILIQSVINLD
jgi:hypothetical protein